GRDVANFNSHLQQPPWNGFALRGADRLARAKGETMGQSEQRSSSVRSRPRQTERFFLRLFASLLPALWSYIVVSERAGVLIMKRFRVRKILLSMQRQPIQRGI